MVSSFIALNTLCSSQGVWENRQGLLQLSLWSSLLPGALNSADLSARVLCVMQEGTWMHKKPVL